MKYLSNLSLFESIQVVGLDLDGTVYDEYEFIKQAYHAIAEYWKDKLTNKDLAYDWMLRRWLEMGSSYPHIFDEAIQNFAPAGVSRTQAVEEALMLFRSFEPRLELSGRIHVFLEDIKGLYGVFLFTDGTTKLQEAKINALNLVEYIDPKNVFISGSYGREYHKPSTLIVAEIEKRFPNTLPHEILYIGDRARDKEFAQRAGFSFAYIQDMFKRIE